MELKQLIFIVITLGFIPVATIIASKFEWAERLLVVGAFFSTAYLVDINFVSMEEYRGDTRGFEFGVTDWMMISLILVMHISPRWKAKKVIYLPPNTVLILAYLFVVLISLISAYVPVYAGFGIFKLLRGVGVYWVAYNYLRSEEDVRFILMVLAGIVALEFLLVIKQRLGGIYRAPGSLPHSNTLAVYINMMNMIFFSFLLGDKAKGYRQYIYIACVGAGSLMVLATFSRGALVSMILGYGLVVMLSFYDRVSPRKWKIIGLIVLASLPVAIKVAPAIIDRFLNAPEASGESRGFANEAAIAMANDNLFGVGINNYSHAINETDYIRFIDNPVDRGIVHNIYLLHACELGWPGLVIFILMVGNFFRMAWQNIRKRTNDIISVFSVGIFVAMFTLFFQSLLEWLFRQTYVTFEFFMLAGFVAALSRVAKDMKKQKKAEKAKRYFQYNVMQNYMRPGMMRSRR